MQFKFDWNKPIYKNICVNTTILKSKMPWLDRQNITSISPKTHDLKETIVLISNPALYSYNNVKTDNYIHASTSHCA